MVSERFMNPLYCFSTSHQFFLVFNLIPNICTCIDERSSLDHIYVNLQSKLKKLLTDLNAVSDV